MFHSLNPKISIKISKHNYPTKINVKLKHNYPTKTNVKPKYNYPTKTNVNPKHNYPTKTNVKPKHNYPTKTTFSPKHPHAFFKTKTKKFYIKIFIDIPSCIHYASTI
jgi:hypothetical protein